MRRLTFYIIVTADGMYADADGGLDHYEPAEDEHRFANALMRDAGDAVMGRGMYDVMTYWDSVDVEDPAVDAVEREFAVAWQATLKHVASRSQPTLGPNAELIEGDVVAFVRRLKAGDGPDIMLGSGADLLAELTRARLVDIYRFLVIPKAIGQGKAMWASLDEAVALRLVGTRAFSAGSVLLEYEPS